MAFDIYQHVTQQIIDSIEAGTPAWRQPWTGKMGGPAFPLRSNGQAYSGINVLMLWLAANSRGYSAAHWFTYRQAQAEGAQVRKGEKSTTIVKYGTRQVEDKETGEDKEIGYLRSYAVFNAQQIDGLPSEFYETNDEAPRDLGTEADPALDGFFAKTGIALTCTDEPRAYYHRALDQIHMPPVATFHNADGYYGTLAHEAIHATGHAARLDRFARFNNRQDYAFEELVAEIGNCMLCAQIGVTPDFGQSAAYVKGWLAALADDKRLIFKAASEAQKCADWLLKDQPHIETKAAA